MKVGLIGESPHDTKSIENLLSRVYPDVQFINLIDDIHGSQLDHQKTKRLLRVEYELIKPDLVVFIRDLDALATDRTQLRKRVSYFSDFKSVVNKRALYLLNIYEIEALILCDIDVFLASYSCHYASTVNPQDIVEPKEVLKNISKKYVESHNSQLFKELDFTKLVDRSPRFKSFVTKFEKVLNN